MDLLTKLEDKFNEFIDFLEDLPEDVVYKFRKGVFRFNKLVDFIKLGWKDEDYDYGYMTDLMVYKMTKMEKLLTNEGLADDSLLQAKRLRVARKALALWSAGDFQEEFDKKYKTVQWGFNWETSPLDMVYKGTTTSLSKEDMIIVIKENTLRYKFEKRRMKRYKKIFFKIMYNHYLEFWD